MINARRLGRFLPAALALTLAFGTVPAFAGGASAAALDPVVGYHVTISGTSADLFGMTAEEASAAIAAACPTSTLAPLAAVAAKKTYALDVGRSSTCDVGGMAADAMAASADTTLSPRWQADPAAIAAFVAKIAKAVALKPVNARRTVVKRRLKLKRQVDGASVNTSSAVAVVSAAVSDEFAAGGAQQPTVTVPVTVVRAKVTTTNIGKTIVIVLRERRLYLYKNAKVEKSYRCAIGMPAHPTPRGTWKIVRKVKNPSWYNNGSAWAARMPHLIGPGRNNPLGTRALYLNASGIRIHGIPARENSSIGRAASHGCIRLKNSNAVNLYPRVSVGTPVYIVK